MSLAALLLSLFAASARAQAPQMSAPRVIERACPADYREKRRGDCVLASGSDRYYVHRAGWIVDSACFHDKRWTAAELRSALDLAARKFSPAPAAAGGCLADYNPGWAKEMTDRLWTDWLYVRCPSSYDPASSTCANARPFDDGEQKGTEISLLNAKPCLDPKGTGFAGILFHETLHADGADSFPVEKHNDVQHVPQFIMVKDRVYATEALCFLPKEQVNILQCRTATDYNVEHPDRALCAGFNHVFYDVQPPGFFKH
jgi:hypothetical protein